MADTLSPEQLETFLQELGKRYAKPATLYLLGGGALILLGSTRLTLDIDYVGIDLPDRWDELQILISQIADELDLKIDAVPNDMIPPLADTEQRQILVGTYGKLQVVIIDPYAIAIGKLDRGFPTDIEDVVFLIRRNYIQLAALEKTILEILPTARTLDLTPQQIQQNLTSVRQLLKRY